ncbi:hypothetical protein ELQ35_10020 [Peribacillus cavernae]|uniref:Uncharacterized protein n=1 Tax=Peribacillus cavernae TaxID=1674310 RepID=A0A433HM61_9BACI|nr:hypothetical protein [Peribacillus cavernae]MDQ0219001.1 hypothetical protein [Peribacillus cavernae]RUQ29293.1 hypothetical protein ELQ35_10020 [Peribacillus cavernae]
MDGLFFYWILWMAWVVVMFFIPKTFQSRYAILFHLLAVMFLAAYELHVYRYVINSSSIYLLIICSFYCRNLSLYRTIEFIICSFIISLGYSCFQLYALLDPVWLIFKADWMLGFFLNYLAVVLFQDWKRRTCALVIGMILGETIFSGLLLFHSLPYKAGSYSWLDTAVLLVLINLAWALLEFASRFIQGVFANQQAAKGASRLR